VFVVPVMKSRVEMLLPLFQVQYCMYVVAQAGSRDCYGRIIYVMIAQQAAEESQQEYFDVLLPSFFESNSADKVLWKMPPQLSEKAIQIIESRWTFFNQLRQDVIANHCYSFHPTAFSIPKFNQCT
jgi:hypothetical protein